jgi:Tfp pilus assembly protein PilN
MIEINLLPGSGRKSRGRGTGFGLTAIVASISSRVRDPYLISAAVSIGAAVAVISMLHVTQLASASTLGEREQRAVQDSTRFVAVLQERTRAEAQRDSVRRQLEILRAIDNDRFVWPHVMDEVSRALPPFTWLKSLTQLNPTVPVPQAVADTTTPPAPQNMTFRIVGNTVDIQALTRFMKLLETSPFVQNVQLARSELVLLDGQEVTEFQLDAEYQRPDSTMVTTVPASLSVR